MPKKTKPAPKLGEDIVAPLSEVIVTDPAAIEAAFKDTEPASMTDIDTTSLPSPTPDLDADAATAAAPETAPEVASDPDLSGVLAPPAEEPADPSDPYAPANVEAGFTALVEGGGRVLLETPNKYPHSRSIRSRDGRYFEHVSDAPSGEWVYRQS